LDEPKKANPLGLALINTGKIYLRERLHWLRLALSDYPIYHKTLCRFPAPGHWKSYGTFKENKKLL
jgi:hypothetical protein